MQDPGESMIGSTSQSPATILVAGCAGAGVEGVWDGAGAGAGAASAVAAGFYPGVRGFSGEKTRNGAGQRELQPGAEGFQIRVGLEVERVLDVSVRQVAGEAGLLFEF